MAASMVSYVSNDLLTHLCDLEIGIGAYDITDDALRARLEEFLAVFSKDPGWKLEKCFEAIKYVSRMVNPTSGVIDLWIEWNA